LQDSASSDVPSVDREASVECDPLSKVTDSGIFGCGEDSHCVKSEESELGGFCVSSKQAPSIDRALQQNATCVENDSFGFTCDCSEFDNTRGAGNLTCILSEYCIGTICVNLTYSASYNGDGSYSYERCIELEPNMTPMGLESYCYYVSSVLNSTECEMKANGVVCNSCEFEQSTCPSHPTMKLAVVDCTNTVFNITGSLCENSLLTILEASMETTTPSKTGAPSAAPSMPTTATTSGSSQEAKVTLVVSAAAAAWMASFGM
jgi:hypothetical protein